MAGLSKRPWNGDVLQRLRTWARVVLELLGVSAPCILQSPSYMFSTLYGKPSCAAFKTTSWRVSAAIRSMKLAGCSSPQAETQGLNHPQCQSLLLFPFFRAVALQSNRNMARSASVRPEKFPGITASLGPCSLSYYLPHCCCFGNRSF